MISIREVSKVFGQGVAAFTALDRVQIDIGQNEFFTLLGPSGCGKTTLLRLIAGFDYPTMGEIRLFGQDIARQPPFKRPINTVFQNYALFPHMTVGQNVGFGLEMLGRPKAEIAGRVDEMLRLVRMEALKDRRTSEISGGQQQRVALARALAPQPKVLLLDEPLSALDYKLRKEMQIELKRLQHETGITFIFVTHDQEEALTMSDRIAVMSGGRVLQIGSAHDIYERPTERFVANFIGETNFLEGQVQGGGSVALDAGSVVPALPPEGFAPSGRVTVVIRPEHARLVPSGTAGSLAGTVSNAVYFGTDTHYHVTLGDGSEFMVRQQNSRASASHEIGAPVGVAIDEGAARMLRD
nr:ABC transporter ATP-binding protein [Acidimangrovimonas sediminis]